MPDIAISNSAIIAASFEFGSLLLNEQVQLDFYFLLLLFLYCFTKGTPLIHHITYAIVSSAIKFCIGLRLRQWTPALS